MFTAVRKASLSIPLLSDEKRRSVLFAVCDAIEERYSVLLEANRADLAAMNPSSPLYDRLKLTSQRLSSIASDMRQVALLPSPLGVVLEDRTLPNGLRLRKTTVPFGVIGVIYEARPNVTFDVFSLCFKSGNACVLKGGRDAFNSNMAAVTLIRDVLARQGVDENAVCLLEPSHEAARALLEAVGQVDLVIPRGGRALIDFVRNNAKVPCIETGAGVVNTYFHSDGDLRTGRAIVNNAKTRRVSVCNALDCLIIDSSRLDDLPSLVGAMSGVTLYADERSFAALSGNYDPSLLCRADASSFGTEFMDYKMAVKTVDGIEEALEHIRIYGSGHSECIITSNPVAASRFQAQVDAACVYVNAPTSFTDGAQFGLGAEIGISTQKLGARGPMGLREICSYKWLIDGNGQIRE